MVYAAQNLDSYNSLGSVDFSSYGFGTLAKNFQNGMSGTSAASSTNSATNAGARTESGFGSGFNFRSFGEMKDAESQDGYEPDADREMATERAAAPSKEIANLNAYQELRGKGFTHNDIYQAQTRFGTSNEVMLHNVNTSESQELVPANKQAELTAQMKVQELMQDSQLREKMQDGAQAQNGVSASMAGAQTSIGVARMAFA